MRVFKSIVKSIVYSVLAASLSIPIVYAFDGLLGGGGLAQVSNDLKHLIPEKIEKERALAETSPQSFDDQDSFISKSAARQDVVDIHTDPKAKFFSRILNN